VVQANRLQELVNSRVLRRLGQNRSAEFLGKLPKIQRSGPIALFQFINQTLGRQILSRAIMFQGLPSSWLKGYPFFPPLPRPCMLFNPWLCLIVLIRAPAFPLHALLFG